MDLVNEILRGIRDELDDTPEYYEFRVKKSEEIGSLWSVQVDLTNNFSSGLDESLEEAIAWWFRPPSGSADVLSVIPEEETINLRFATKPHLQKGNQLGYTPQDIWMHYYKLGKSQNGLLNVWQDIMVFKV